MWEHTNTKHRADEQDTAQHKLPVNRVSVGIGGELKEERSDNSGSWGIVVVHTTMSLVEQGVVVWEERVANG